MQFCVAQCIVAACGLSGTEASSDHRTDAKTLIIETMEQRLRPIQGTRFEGRMTSGFPDSVRFTTENSRLVPQLKYFEGSFQPTQSYDAGLVVRAAELGSRSVILERPADWSALVATGGGWRPRSDIDAQSTCEEIINRVLQPSGAKLPTIIFKDTTSLTLSREAIVVEPDRSLIVERARAPIVRRVDDGRAWEVDIWAVEFGRTMEYRCHISAQARDLEIRVVTLDSLGCSGQLASCGLTLDELRRSYRRPP
jgi:hypothetical protein